MAPAASAMARVVVASGMAESIPELLGLDARGVGWKVVQDDCAAERKDGTDIGESWVQPIRGFRDSGRGTKVPKAKQVDGLVLLGDDGARHG